MLILLEGCDGVGKTTVAERLAGYVGLTGQTTIMHKGPMTADAITEYESPLFGYEPLESRHIICDRWHIGELIYGPLLRGEARLSKAELRHIDSYLASLGAVVAICHAPVDTVLERIADRGDDLIDATMVDSIIDAYGDVLHAEPWHTPTTGLVLTGDEEADNNVLRSLVQSAIEIEIRAKHARGNTYIGPAEPKVLLLGERRNGLEHPVAFTPTPASSGRYLLEAVPRMLWAVCGVANALEEDLPALWERLGEPYVVALGHEAYRACERNELPHVGAVPHPQFVRRFHHGKSLEYGRMIREAAFYERNLLAAFTH